MSIKLSAESHLRPDRENLGRKGSLLVLLLPSLMVLFLLSCAWPGSADRCRSMVVVLSQPSPVSEDRNTARPHASIALRRRPAGARSTRGSRRERTLTDRRYGAREQPARSLRATVYPFVSLILSHLSARLGRACPLGGTLANCLGRRTWLQADLMWFPARG